jgi:hypothetical protein
MLPDDGERYLGAGERFLGAHGFDEEIYLWVRYEPPMCETEANFYEDVCESAGLTCAAVNRMFFSEGFYRTRQVLSDDCEWLSSQRFSCVMSNLWFNFFYQNGRAAARSMSQIEAVTFSARVVQV